MYAVAQVDISICSATSCRLCTQYCPEANTILYDNKRKTAYIAVDRCKGCELCVGICDNIAKHRAIKMVPVTDVHDGFEMSKYGFPRNGR
ncbi:MAG: pyruvate ferredoxin oxidoreductase [Nitrospirae bacterium]|nr:pyruvate ferredoxin oxidoreductase [Nitrospirota bacterium]